MNPNILDKLQQEFEKQQMTEDKNKVDRAAKARLALEILIPLSLAAGGAYATYKMFPKLVNYIAPTKPTYLTTPEIKGTLEAANKDVLYSASKFFKERGIDLPGMI